MKWQGICWVTVFVIHISEKISEYTNDYFNSIKKQLNKNEQNI